MVRGDWMVSYAVTSSFVEPVHRLTDRLHSRLHSILEGNKLSGGLLAGKSRPATVSKENE